MITPQNNIQLLSVPWTADQENQLTFKTLQDQNRYFEGLNKLILDNTTYQRRDSVIRYPGNADSLQYYNYVRYENKQFQNKWFYAFITKVEYINENMTYIHIKTDVFQTWQFNFQLDTSFVEREHVASDGFGEHTIPENLEHGSYIVQNYIPMNWANPEECVICMQVTDFPTSAHVTTTPAMYYNGMPSGCYYLVFKLENITNLNRWVKAYANDTKADAILAIFPIPGWLATPQAPGQEQQIELLQNSLDNTTYIFKPTGNPVELTSYQIPSSLGSSFEGYTPRNNKLYVAPYCYFYLNTFTGSTVEYNYENFNGPIIFSVYGAITAGGEFKIFPQNIRGAGSGSYGYGVSLASMPQGSWNNNTYDNWRALNSDAIAIQAETDSLTTMIGHLNDAFNLNFLGIATNEISYQSRVKQRLNQQRIAAKMPNQARGDTATQTLNWSLGRADGGFYQMGIRREYAEMIDKYFDMFGYEVDTVKVPVIDTRKNHNYIKTVGCNIEADIPNEDIEELKRIFDRGCTFWHNPNTFLNYSAANDII